MEYACVCVLDDGLVVSCLEFLISRRLLCQRTAVYYFMREAVIDVLVFGIHMTHVATRGD